MLDSIRENFLFRGLIKSRIGFSVLCFVLVLIVKTVIENVPQLTTLYESIFLDSYTLRKNIDLSIFAISSGKVSVADLRNQLELGDWVVAIVSQHGVYSHIALFWYVVSALLLLFFFNLFCQSVF